MGLKSYHLWYDNICAFFINFPGITERFSSIFHKSSTGWCFEIVPIFAVEISTHPRNL